MGVAGVAIAAHLRGWRPLRMSPCATEPLESITREVLLKFYKGQNYCFESFCQPRFDYHLEATSSLGLGIYIFVGQMAEEWTRDHCTGHWNEVKYQSVVSHGDSWES